MWHILSLFLHWEKNKTYCRKWHCRFTWDRRRASSEGCKITLAKSSGWSHHKEDKTKGHSKPWIICCCHPTPSHNPSLCDSLFCSYIMNGRPWSALSIPVPQYSNNTNVFWPELSGDEEGKVDKHFQHEFVLVPAQCAGLCMWGYCCSHSEHPQVPAPGRNTWRLLKHSGSVTFTLAVAAEMKSR